MSKENTSNAAPVVSMSCVLCNKEVFSNDLKHVCNSIRKSMSNLKLKGTASV